MRKIFLIMGIALGIIAAAGLVYFNMLNQPVVSRVVVARRDVTAGSLVNADDFRIATWADIDRDALARYVTAAEFGSYDGRMLTTDVRAGFPLGKAQIDPETPEGIEVRLSTALTNTGSYYFVMPVTPDDIGNWVQPNDQVDLLVTVGQIEAREFQLAGQDPLAQSELGVGEPLSRSVLPPATKLVLQGMRIVRVDRERIESNASVTGNARGYGATGPADDDHAPNALDIGNVQRIYLEVSKDQLEILTFVKRSGKHDFAVRAMRNRDLEPTPGLAFTDYVRWFFAQRGAEDDALPMAAAGPYQPADQTTNVGGRKP